MSKMKQFLKACEGKGITAQFARNNTPNLHIPKKGTHGPCEPKPTRSIVRMYEDGRVQDNVGDVWKVVPHGDNFRAIA